MVHDLRELLRLASGKAEKPSAVILDGRAFACLMLSEVTIVLLGSYHPLGTDDVMNERRSSAGIA
jgi:hypothetical protein